MRHTTRTLILVLLAAGCADQAVSPIGQADVSSARADQGPIVHRVSVGGPDQCAWLGQKPGCDGNFSLIAMQREDGSVSGQWSDQYGEPGGLHAVVDCLKVQVIPERTTLEAWVGGVVTRPTHQAGHRVITRMRDNGTSAHDLADALGRGIVDPEEEGFSSNCQDYPPADGFDMGLARVPQGQVTIW